MKKINLVIAIFTLGLLVACGQKTDSDATGEAKVEATDEATCDAADSLATEEATTDETAE
jgi:major membrane immunogen (membrane-anchored lipoprotein)